MHITKSPVWGWRCREKCKKTKKKKPSTFCPALPSHSPCFPLSLCALLCLLVCSVPKWIKMRNWNTQGKTQRRTLASYSFSIVSYQTVAIVDRIGTTRCAFLSPCLLLLLLLLRNSISFLSKNLLLCSLGGFFQNFVVQKCYRCSGWEDFSFLFLRSVKII